MFVEKGWIYYQIYPSIARWTGFEEAVSLDKSKSRKKGF